MSSSFNYCIVLPRLVVVVVVVIVGKRAHASKHVQSEMNYKKIDQFNCLSNNGTIILMKIQFFGNLFLNVI